MFSTLILACELPKYRCNVVRQEKWNGLFAKGGEYASQGSIS